MARMTRKNLNITMLLAGALFDYNIQLAKNIRDKYPKSKISALVSGRHYLMDNIRKLDDTDYAFNRYDYLNDMIPKWINEPVNKRKLNFYKKKLGNAALHRIMTSDRNIGFGYVRGGYVERSPLIDFFEKNPDRRWSYIIGLLDYCFDLIKTQKPDIIYTYTVAGADALAMHIVAEHFNIPAVQLTYARFGNSYVVDPSTRMQMPNIEPYYKRALKNKKLVADTYDDAAKYIDDFVNTPAKTADIIHWNKKVKKEKSLLGFAQTITKDLARWTALSFGMIGSKGIWRQRYGSEMLKLSIWKFWYMHTMNLSEKNSLKNLVGDTPFIYFPLHVEPELTTAIMAENFTDQLSIIEYLSKHIPAGWKVVVKDHIPMMGRRSKEYYRQLRSLPDVVMVSPFENNFQIMKKCQTTVTITGTAGWENMLIGKVPVVMGNPHYLNVGEGFVHCTEPTKLGDAIEEALKTKPASRDKLKIYKASIMKNSFEMSLGHFWFKEDFPKEKLDRSLEQFLEKLEEMAN